MSPEEISIFLRQLEKRVDKLEQGVYGINEKIGNLHNTSMAWVNDALSDQTAALNASTRELERRIFDKIEERSASSRSQLIMTIVAFVGWLLSIGGLLVAIFKH
jgi:hypothetical protein